MTSGAPISGAPAALLTDHAAPSCQALGRMLVHPLGELWCAHQAGLHRDLGEVRRGDDLLVTTGPRGEATKYGNNLDHERLLPSLRRGLAPVSSPAGSFGGKMLS